MAHHCVSSPVDAVSSVYDTIITLVLITSVFWQVNPRGINLLMWKMHCSALPFSPLRMDPIIIQSVTAPGLSPMYLIPNQLSSSIHTPIKTKLMDWRWLSSLNWNRWLSRATWFKSTLSSPDCRSEWRTGSSLSVLCFLFVLNFTRLLVEVVDARPPQYPPHRGPSLTSPVLIYEQCTIFNIGSQMRFSSFFLSTRQP